MNARLLLLTLPLLALPPASAAPESAVFPPPSDWIHLILERATTSPLAEARALAAAAPEAPQAAEVAVDVAAEAGGAAVAAARHLPNLGVKVETLQAGRPGAKPGAIQVRTPFPAKPLGVPPAGWHLELPTAVPPIIHQVEISPGSRVVLTIRPQVLTPDTDGDGTFEISEPGFDPALGYLQTNTVGAVLAQSVRQLDDDAKRLGFAIDQLQQLLIALPKPAPGSALKSDPVTKSKSAKNR